MDIKRERGMEDAVLYEKGGYSLIDVEHFETKEGRCCHLS